MTLGAIVAYCTRCKAKQIMGNVTVIRMKNGRPAARGTCPKCGRLMLRYLSRKERETHEKEASSVE